MLLSQLLRINCANLPLNNPQKACKFESGITLIELMVTVGISAIVTSIALPNFNDFIVQLRVDNEIYRLGRLLHVARNHAIHSNSHAIVCPLKSGTCTSDWHKTLSVFVDNNSDQKFNRDDGDLLIATKAAIKSGDILIYAKNRTKITYQASGHLFGLANGTFRYCPKNFEQKSRAIVIARSGRFYSSLDINKDGIDETRSNKAISCN
jgi:type IV fimbrial biogenesis protein FimT